MRKKIAALLCALMCVMAFTGCSKAEMQYLQMSADMLQNMPVAETKGTTTITMDFDALEKFMQDTASAMGVTTAVAEEFPFDGKETVQLDYTMTVDLNNLRILLDVDATHKGKTYDFGKLYYGMEGMYITSQTLQGVYDLMQATMQQYSDNYMFDETYAKDFKAILDKNEYICLYDIKELGLNTEELQAMMPPANGYGDLYKAAFDLYKKGFANFTTGLVTEISNGFRIEATGEQVGQMVVSILDYTMQNPEPVLQALEEYILASGEMSGFTAQDVSDLKDAFAEAKQDIESVRSILTQMKEIVSATLQQPAVASALKGFSYKAETTYNHGVCTITEDYVMGNVCTITTKATTQKATSAVTYPANATSLDDLMTQMQELTVKYNPVAGVEVMWILEDESKEAFVSMVREDDDLLFPYVAQEATLSYDVENGRVYLPLRDICDELGIFVTWDKDTKTVSAYLEKENMDKAVKLETKLIDGTSYVGVREFEKLGYTVTYTNTEGIHEALITK